MYVIKTGIRQGFRGLRESRGWEVGREVRF